MIECIKKYKFVILDIGVNDPFIKIMFSDSVDEGYELTNIFSDIAYKEIMKKSIDKIECIDKVKDKTKYRLMA